jgi:putative phosphoribosyl transferase
MFHDRLDAARRLLGELTQYRGQNALVLGVPRGGVPMAALIAEGLEGELDVVLVHKLKAPYQAEFAIGAVDESGRTWVSPEAYRAGADDQYLAREAEQELALLRRRRERYARGQPPVPAKGRIVIVVDDGVATGSTLIAGLRFVRRQEPEKLIAAVGVAPTHTLQRLSGEADEVVCARSADGFEAVGQYFEDFTPVSDEEVQRLLNLREAPA